jgi:hypothetical protein
MRRLLGLLLAILCFNPFAEALGCSCAYPKSTRDAFDEAKVVVLGEAISIKQHPIGAPQPLSIVEDDVFRAILVFKGSLRPGELFRVRSIINSAGGCGLSARNSPVWLYKQKGQPLRLSGIWVIYGGGKQPFTLSGCGSSKPIEAGGIEDLHKLVQLTKESNGKVPVQ